MAAEAIQCAIQYLSEKTGRKVDEGEALRLIENVSMVFRLLDEEARRIDAAAPNASRQEALC